MQEMLTLAYNANSKACWTQLLLTIGKTAKLCYFIIQRGMQPYSFSDLIFEIKIDVFLSRLQT